MFTPDHRVHLKLKQTPPGEVPSAAFAEAIFVTLALRGSPAWVPDAGSRPHAASARITEESARPASGELPG
ncbi:MAG: hypothetical protein ACYDHH_03505 [Solirubrobacteraceae bacterium]